MSRCWYVVIEWNQAGGRPRLAVDDLFDDEPEAADTANSLAAETAKVGRRERYSIHEVSWDEQDELLRDPETLATAPNPPAVNR